MSDKNSNLLAAIYEFQGKFSDELMEKLRCQKLNIKDVMLQRDINNVIYFVEKLCIETIDKISITNLGNNKLPVNIISLISKYLDADPSMHKTLRFIAQDNHMKISTVSRRNEKAIKAIMLTLCRKETRTVHGDLIKRSFLQSMLSTLSLLASFQSIPKNGYLKIYSNTYHLLQN